MAGQHYMRVVMERVPSVRGDRLHTRNGISGGSIEKSDALARELGPRSFHNYKRCFLCFRSNVALARSLLKTIKSHEQKTPKTKPATHINRLSIEESRPSREEFRPCGHSKPGKRLAPGWRSVGVSCENHFVEIF
jgi:hypothetical protein